MHINKYYILIALLLFGAGFAHSQEKHTEISDIPEFNDTVTVQNPLSASIDTWVTEERTADEWQRKLYVKANVAGWGMGIANAAVEVDLAKYWSFTLPVYYSAWDYFCPTVKFRTFSIQPEARYWFKEDNNRWFIGAHLGLAYYNFSFNGKYRTQDHDKKSPALGGGLSVGLSYDISKNKLWKMECSLGAGVYSLYYDKFRNYENGLLVSTEKKTYFGIDQANISFAYTFNLKRKEGAR